MLLKRILFSEDEDNKKGMSNLKAGVLAAGATGIGMHQYGKHLVKSNLEANPNISLTKDGVKYKNSISRVTTPPPINGKTSSFKFGGQNVKVAQNIPASLANPANLTPNISEKVLAQQTKTTKAVNNITKGQGMMKNAGKWALAAGVTGMVANSLAKKLKKDKPSDKNFSNKETISENLKKRNIIGSVVRGPGGIGKYVGDRVVEHEEKRGKSQSNIVSNATLGGSIAGAGVGYGLARALKVKNAPAQIILTGLSSGIASKAANKSARKAINRRDSKSTEVE